MDRRIIARSIALGFAAMAAVAVLAFLWVLIYALLIAPGHPGSFYQAYAARVSPISGLVAGLPILFLAGYLASRWSGGLWLVAAAAPALVYVALDALLLALFMPGGFRGWPLLVLSWLSKAGAAIAGGWLARRRARPPGSGAAA
jgi:hypothetical protein